MAEGQSRLSKFSNRSQSVEPLFENKLKQVNPIVQRIFRLDLNKMNDEERHIGYRSFYGPIVYV